MAEPSLDITYCNMAHLNKTNKTEKQMENEVFEVDPFARRTSIHWTPPQPKRVTTLEVQMREPAPVQTPLILIDVEAPRKGAQKGALELKGAIPKARSEGARTMSCPGELSLTTRNVQEASERDSLKDLITLIEGMRAFTVAHKNTHVAPREDVAKAAIIIRRVERAWSRMEEEFAETRRKEISPSTGAAEKRPRPEEQGEKPQQEGWSEVVKRGRRKTAASTPAAPAAPTKNTAAAPAKERGPRPRKPVRPDAVLIKTEGEQNYAEVLKRVRGQVDPDKVGASITAVRRTRGGDVLLELKGSSGAQALKEAVVVALGGQAKVSTLEPTMTIEVRDLDEITTAEETRAALSSALKAPLEGEIRLRSGFRGTQTALTRIPQRTARKLLAIGKVKIGWTACRIRERIMVDRCHRCQGYGHHAVKCLGIDNFNACRRCGETGHKEKDCRKSNPRYIVCTNGGARADHFAGSGQCRAFRVELQKAKDRRNGRAIERESPPAKTRAARATGVNLNRSRAAQDLLTQTAAAHGAEILIVSEPSSTGKQGNWAVDTRGDAAILGTKRLAGNLEPGGKGAGYVWARVSGLTIFSCYYSPNEAIEEFERQLDDLEGAVRAVGTKTLVAGDFNAKSPNWGSSKWDKRGRVVADFLARLDLIPVNEGTAPTWQRASTRASSVIDLTAGTPGVAAEEMGWRVLDDESLSDHRYIYMKWKPRDRSRARTPGSIEKGWVVMKLDKDAMASFLRREKEQRSADAAGNEIDVLMTTVVKACDAGMPKRRPPKGKTATHWWNEKIASLRSQCVRARRQEQRQRARGETTTAPGAYKAARKALRDEIKASKAGCWKELLRTVDEDSWGLPYKLVSRKLGGSRQPDDPEVVERALDELFSIHAHVERPSRAEPAEC
ncbi:uncharacterized protein LOC124181884 [Neodiprion fabricii]|uniref:uncharacterized protein LOC124181884 n=1 Tax=Neodiprion fabricii TaxID=2872261 RepID=UPI001ED91373|nr:uncharacterized protein LOC124181884 [Neodiprion fabricii]